MEAYFEETRNFFQGKATARLKELSNAELIEFHRQYRTKAENMWNFAIFVEPLDEVLPSRLREMVLKRGIEKKEANKFSTVLSSETEVTPVYSRNKQLLEIAGRVKGKKLGFESAEARRMVSEFIRKHYFMLCSYSLFEKPTEKEIVELLKEKLETGKGASKQIEEMQKRLENNLRKKEKVMERLGFDEKEKAVIAVIGKLNKVHEERKELFQRIAFVQGIFLKELARRKGIPFELVGQLTDLDMKAFLAEKICEKELAERRMLSALVFEKGEEPKVLVGKEAEQLVQKIQGKEEQSAEVEGMCASVGTAIGRACVQLKPEPEKFREGSVLITTMTTPEFVPMMSKAAAIVTDEGGITCHAAIVSRELGIPCIVGTKVATKVFKDNDLIEVKANHGVARKIE